MNVPFLSNVITVLQDVKSNTENGLTTTEAQQRLIKYGPNELVEKGKKTAWAILFDQIKELMVIILIIAAVISIFLDEYIDAVVILVIVILNTLIGFWQEYNAENAMAALKKMAVPKVRVRRDGGEHEISAKELVPGDILIIEAGNIIPADARLINAINLKVQESALTGESEAVEKHTESLTGENIPLGDRKNMIYMGTVVTYGRGLAVVIATGMKTELGNIATLLQDVEDEKTPLQERLAGLTTKLAGLALILIAVVAGMSLIRGTQLKVTFMTAISMAVAAIPEGLPAVVTIALALGAKRMLKKKSLIRHLPAVETLGSVTVICTDKTGTLTQNKMTVTQIVLPDQKFEMNQIAGEIEKNQSLRLLMLAGTLCNDSVLRKKNHAHDLNAIGDPTEGALVIAAARNGLLKDEIEAHLPRVSELPFDSDRKRMSTVHQISNTEEPQFKKMLVTLTGEQKTGHVAFSKGSADGLLEVCDRVLVQGKIQKLIPEIKAKILAENHKMAQNGVRVLGFACKMLDSKFINDSAQFETDLIFLGMTGMIDPVRPEAVDAVRTCQEAGIRVVMITGDHPLTALAIAKELGLTVNGNVITGTDLAQMNPNDLKKQINEISVFARVSPEHKMMIIDALQEKNHIVSMTGDGVNDAPALKSADIGVSMGITGTDVARESSDMVLLDDNFATIVEAVKEGRTIFDNIRKFVNYILTGNVGEIIVMLIGPILGLPIPLLPIQILWINLVTDGIPAIALGYEDSEKDIMARPPFRPEEGIFSRGVGRKIIIMGLVIGLISVFLGFFVYKFGSQMSSAWQTMIFTTLTFCQMAYVLGIQRNHESVFSQAILKNKVLLSGVALTFALQLILIYVPFFNQIFRTQPLDMMSLLICIGVSLIILLIVEFEKIFFRRNSIA